MTGNWDTHLMQATENSFFPSFQPYYFFNDTYYTNLQTYTNIQSDKKCQMSDTVSNRKVCLTSLTFISATRSSREIFNTVYIHVD